MKAIITIEQFDNGINRSLGNVLDNEKAKLNATR